MSREWINVSVAKWFPERENIPVGTYGKSATAPVSDANSIGLAHDQRQPSNNCDDSKQNRAKKDAAIVSAGCCENGLLHAGLTHRPRKRS